MIVRVLAACVQAHPVLLDLPDHQVSPLSAVMILHVHTAFC
jgi:hypothetical protein